MNISNKAHCDGYCRTIIIAVIQINLFLFTFTTFPQELATPEYTGNLTLQPIALISGCHVNPGLQLVKAAAQPKSWTHMTSSGISFQEYEIDFQISEIGGNMRNVCMARFYIHITFTSPNR